MRRKLMVVFSIITLAYLVLIGRLTYINSENGTEYAKIVLAQQSYDSVTIPYRRGDITDANGTILATSTRTYNVILDVSVMTDDEIEPTVEALTACYTELDADELYEYIEENPNSAYKVLLKQISYSEMQEFETMRESDTQISTGGVWFETQYVREYPYDSLAASVIGFTSSDGTGMLGIEAEYDDYLTGVDGREYGYLNSASDVETEIIDAQDGDTIVTTIDITVQQIVEEHILAFNEEHEDEAEEGEGSANTGVIVMDPDTGEILAMANYPTFDLNNPRDLSDYYTEEELAEMTSDEQTDALNSLWSNYCITGTFEPGSTAKVMTLSAALETGTVTTDDSYYCDGVQTVADYEISCSHVHGMQTLKESFANSCNDAFMQIGAALGTTLFSSYQNIFNIGLRTNIDLPGEARTDSLIYTADEMSSVDLATNAFGQNFNVTMIQLASAFCSVVNGGYYYQPHVVKQVVDADGNVVLTNDSIIMKETISEETSELMREMLEDVVDEGTGTKAQIEGYTIGGKTGTAEKLPRGNGKYVVSFIACVPADDPEVVIYVVIDEPNVADQAQSSLAVNLAREILEDILPYLGIYADTDTDTEAVSEETDADTQITDVQDTTEDTAAEDTAAEDTAAEDAEAEDTAAEDTAAEDTQTDAAADAEGDE